LFSCSFSLKVSYMPNLSPIGQFLEILEISSMRRHVISFVEKP